MGSPDAGGVLPVVEVHGPPFWGYTGAISDHVLYIAGRFRVISMDLSCTPPQADFIWYPMGRNVRFIDRTTFDDRYDDRMWEWTISGDPRVFQSRSPLVEFDEYGAYQVTMYVTTETGTVSITKTIEVGPDPGGNLIFLDGFEFRNASAWSNAAGE